MLLFGLACVIVTEIYAAIMQLKFQNTDNRVGKGFAILGIFLFVVCYCEYHLNIFFCILSTCGEWLTFLI